ncbi:MAG: restriction endonuclease subunit R [Cyanosarcina radialis HA8281-LM2]|jgi:hypothetical protein|nr:restriction endonuclease subunit R [Cyanosarcina radialis HA8281-LM2]
MTLILEASNLSLDDVHRLLKPEKQIGESFANLLSLEPITEIEQQDLWRIRDDFDRYLSAGKISEGMVKFLTLAPLMRLTGFYDAPIKMTMEDSIAISVEDEDTTITGRMDILAVNNARSLNAANFWILVIEAKNSAIAVSEGLPQLLTYAFKSLDRQSSVWGLATNGESYRFVRLSQGNPPIYQILPELNLIDRDRSLQLIQVLKAICKLQDD